MRYKLYILIIVFTIATIFVGCDETSLPPITDTSDAPEPMGIPEPVFNGAITVPTNRLETGTLMLAWKYPDTTGSIPPNGVRITYYIADTDLAPTKDVFDIESIEFKSYTFHGLLEDTVYVFEIRTYNDAGESDMHLVRGKTRDNTRPKGVQTLKATPGAEQVTLEWVNPDDEDSTDFHHVLIESDKHAESIRVDGSQNTKTITGLINDTTYTFTVIAYDDAGLSNEPSENQEISVAPSTMIDSDTDGLIDIGTPKQLNAVRYNVAGTSYRESPDITGIVNGCPDDGCHGYELIADIDLASIGNFAPLGTGATPFSGTFNGNGYVIRNLNVDGGAANDDWGLFGRVSGIIHNVVLRDAVVAGRGNVGALAGLLTANAEVSNSAVINGSITGSDNDNVAVGGMVGTIEGGTVQNCYATATVRGGVSVRAGGLAGVVVAGSNVSHSYTVGHINGGDNSTLGGLVGEHNGAVIGSYTTANITGGITSNVGALSGSGNGTMTDTYYHVAATLVGETIHSGGTGLNIHKITAGHRVNFGGFLRKYWRFGNDELPSVIGIDDEEVPGQPFYATDIDTFSNISDPAIPATPVDPNVQYGTITRPYEIDLATELASIATGFYNEQTSGVALSLEDSLNAHYRLTADIDLMPMEDFVSIGNETVPFRGTFDGGDYTVSNFVIDGGSSVGHWGLFGFVTGATIHNVTLHDATIAGAGSIGVLVGYAGDAILRDITVTNANMTVRGGDAGTLAGYLGKNSNPNTAVTNSAVIGTTLFVDQSSDAIGGLIGVNDGASIVGSTAEPSGITIVADDQTTNVGGLVGSNLSGAIDNSHTTGDLGHIKNVDNLGGLVGLNRGGTISNSHTTNSVHHAQEVDNLGGLVGLNEGGTISDSYTTGAVSNNRNIDYIGGLVGVNEGGIVEDSHASGVMTLNWNGSGIGGLIGRNGDDSIVRNSYSSSALRNTRRIRNVGGLVGLNEEAAVEHSHAIGAITFKITGDSNTPSTNIGGLVGQNKDGDISNNYATGAVSGGSYTDNTGGLVGLNIDEGVVENSYATGTVNDEGGLYDNIGGLVGSNIDRAIVRNSYATGEVRSGRTLATNPNMMLHDVGGLVGSNINRASVRNSYATGNVYAYQQIDNVGGLVGRNHGSPIVLHDVRGTVRNSYATGDVNGGVGLPDNVGGLVGWDRNVAIGSVTNSYFNNEAQLKGGYRDAGDGNHFLCADAISCYVTPGNYYFVYGSGRTVAQLISGNRDNLTGFSLDDWQIVANELPMVIGTDNVVVPGQPVDIPVAPSVPYYIDSLEDLQSINTGFFDERRSVRLTVEQSLSASYVLTTDIDMSSATDFQSIGVGRGFNGSFDGDGHEISNLTVEGGLFSLIWGEDTIVSDLTLRNVTVTGTQSVGGLAGEVSSGATIDNVAVIGGTVKGDNGDNSVGGLTGALYGTIRNSSAAVDIDAYAGGDFAGGLVGKSVSFSSISPIRSLITNSHAKGRVNGGADKDYVGGLVGHSIGEIQDSYATGRVAGGAGDSDAVGGLVGFISGTVENSYATGNVFGDSGDSDIVGGLVGHILGTVKNSYAIGNVLGGRGRRDEVGGLIGYLLGTVRSSYATGDVSGHGAGGHFGDIYSYDGLVNASSYDDYVGGLVGRTNEAIDSNYRNNQTLIFSYAHRNNGGHGRSVAQLLSGNRALFNGFDTANWHFVAGSLPMVRVKGAGNRLLLGQPVRSPVVYTGPGQRRLAPP